MPIAPYAGVMLLVVLFACALGAANTASGQSSARIPTAEQPPRKITIATFKSNIAGSKQQRVDAIRKLVTDAATAAQKQYGRKTLDLVVIPEFALHEGSGSLAREQAIAADDPAVVSIGDLARTFSTYIVLPVVLKETADGQTRYANAALLLDRSGKVTGIYRKAHPMTSGPGVFEGGVTPGNEYPVFNCDFGRLGIQICWDMCYEEGWRALAENGAEIVALPSASPQTIRPAAFAQQYRYWVVLAAPRDNASIYNPIGISSARTEVEDVLVHQVDLSSAIVHWNERVEEGRAFARAFGERGGYTWSSREDTGLFWSNDATMPVGAMLRQLGIPQMDAEVQRVQEEIRNFKR